MACLTLKDKKLLSQILKNCTDVHVPFEISGKSQRDHTSIESQERGNQIDIIFHVLIIEGLFAALWPPNLWR